MNWSDLKPREKFSRVFAEESPGLWPHREEEFLFDDERKWRFDFAWPAVKVAVEIDGFGFGHQAQQRLAENHEKQNAAVRKGWSILRYTSRQLGSKQHVSDAVCEVSETLCDAIEVVSELTGVGPDAINAEESHATTG